jgi:hypothetical protein
MHILKAIDETRMSNENKLPAEMEKKDRIYTISFQKMHTI